MNQWIIRPFRSDEYQALADIQNAVIPDTPAVAEDYSHIDETRDPQCQFQRWVAELDGRVVGMGQYDQNLWVYHPRKFDLRIRVLPDCQRQGIGSALYDQIRVALEGFDPIGLRSWTRSDLPQGMHFLEKRGFGEFERQRQSRLDVAAFDYNPYTDVPQRMQALGIEIRTLRELESDPDRDRKLYDLDWETSQDVPGSDRLTRLPLDKWVEDVLRSPTALPDAFFVAVCPGRPGSAGDQYVGLSFLGSDRASDMLFQGFTGVHRSWRRKGLAVALKLRGIAYAREHGSPTIITGNDATNRPMLSINNRLGFVPQPDWIGYQKIIHQD